MRGYRHGYRWSTLLALVAVAALARADDEPRLEIVDAAANRHLVGAADPSAAKVYIVQLASPSAAEFFSAMPRTQKLRQAARPSAAPQKMDRTSAAVEAYTRQLDTEYSRVLGSIGAMDRTIYRYRYSLNGFAATLTPTEADALRANPDVVRVWEDEIRPLATRTSVAFLGLFDQPDGLRTEFDGEDVIIGVIDSGVAPGHPALLDVREADRPRTCQSIWGRTSVLGVWLCRRYDVRPDILDYEPPEDWNGICQTGPSFPESACNNKMIGARFFVDGADQTLPIDPDEIRSPADVYGHGTHVATTAAGNQVFASIFGTLLGSIQGVAPRARVATYKACWVRTGDMDASCNTSDLANAIDTAVADGVDLINYSVGSSLLDPIAPDDIALLNAAKAGVLAVVAAGNDGPNLGTIGSPAGNPAVISVGASSRDGEFSEEALQVTEPASVTGRYAVREASFTPALADRDPIEEDLILVDDEDETTDDGSDGTTYDGCQAIVNETEVSGKIAYMQRGGCDFDVKVENAEAAGAVAALIFNIAGDPIVMIGDPGDIDIPALMIGQADGNLLFDEINDGNNVEVVLDKGLLLSTPEDGNVMGVFSSRGPGPVNDVLKPDVTAPGINILAGFTPLSITSAPNENYAFITGTSMSTPHVTGVAALLKEAHPEWTPAAIKSSLMTTARQDVVQQDEETSANPFDFGAGHIAPNGANDPGLVYDLTAEDYDAYSCAVNSPAISIDRCTALEASGAALTPAEMNLPSIAVSRLASRITLPRFVTNPGDEVDTYTADIEAPTGIGVTVEPPTLAVAPGQTQRFDVTLTYQTGPLDLWRFGALTWSGNDHTVRNPIAVRPVSITAPEEVDSFGGTGTLTFPMEFGYAGTYTPGVHGLRQPLVIDGFVDEDPTRTFTFRSDNGVTSHFVTVSPNQAYLRFWLRDEFTDGDDDLDMYIYYSTDGSTFTRIGESGTFSSDEEFNLFQPPPGIYGVYVHGFRTDNSDAGGGPGANYQLLAWEFGFDDNVGNMAASGPGSVTPGARRDITVSWANLASETIYLGAISHNTPQGLVGLTIVRIRN